MPRIETDAETQVEIFQLTQGPRPTDNIYVDLHLQPVRPPQVFGARVPEGSLVALALDSDCALLA